MSKPRPKSNSFEDGVYITPYRGDPNLILNMGEIHALLTVFEKTDEIKVRPQVIERIERFLRTHAEANAEQPSPAKES
jgi:hypothetical protein